LFSTTGSFLQAKSGTRTETFQTATITKLKMARVPRLFKHGLVSSFLYRFHHCLFMIKITVRRLALLRLEI
jgi:hypothetical protein